MLPIVSLFVVVTLSILITRIATIALSHTGLSREVARLQARSAFTGVGYTTTESEKVVNHPVRRRVLLTLMLLGNAGVVSAVTSLLLTFLGSDSSFGVSFKIAMILTGLVALWTLAHSQRAEHWLSNIVDSALRRFTKLDLCDYAGLLRLAKNYSVTELNVKNSDWLCERTLAQTKLRDEGILVLGITRETGNFLGTPTGETKIKAGDTLILYGRTDSMEELDTRARGGHGEERHQQAVAQQEHEERKEREEDQEKRE